VGFVVGAGVAGVGGDRTRQGLHGVERGDADGVVDHYLDFYDGDYRISAGHRVFLAFSMK
jgi:hypothetical protein